MNFTKPYGALLALVLMSGCAGRKNRVQVPAAIQTPPTSIQVWRPLGFVPLPDAEVRPPVQPADSGQATVGATPAPASQNKVASSSPEPEVVPTPPARPWKKRSGKAPRPAKALHREPAPVAPPSETSGADKTSKQPEGGGFPPIGLALLPVGAAALWLTGRAVAKAASKRGG